MKMFSSVIVWTSSTISTELYSVEDRSVLYLDEHVSLSRRSAGFLNLNWIILGWISDKVLNLDNFPPSKCGRVLQSQQNYTPLKTRHFIDLNKDVSPQLNYGHVLKTQPRHSLSWSTGKFLNLNKNQASPAESSTTTSMQILAKETLMRSTLL